MAQINGIEIKEKVTYLGIQIKTKDQQERESLSFNPIIKKAENKFNLWLQRDFGRS